MAAKGEKRSPTSHKTPSQERKHTRVYQSTTVEKKKRAARNKARRQLEREGKVSKGDGKDVGHKKPLARGGSKARSNLQVQSRKKNRGHGMANQHTKKSGRRSRSR